MKGIFLFYFAILLFACKEKYVPELKNPSSGFLVVEGFINNGSGTTTINLSRTTKLIDTTTILRERMASVFIEGKLNATVFTLSEISPGVYTRAQLSLNPDDQYRVHIRTRGKEYVSDYSAVRTTPDIDSVSWQRKNGGVQIMADTHDPQNKTKYYQYKYDETWEFHSKYTSSLKLGYDTRGKVNGVGYRDSMTYSFDSTLYKCWRTESLTNIEIATSERLTQDLISNFPLIFIEPNSWRLSVLYSINVKQYAMSKQAFRFTEQLKKNTEQLGTIFDPQPSDNGGNIHCVTDPNEIVVGFVEVTQEKQKRIFISNAQVTGWRYNPGCEPEVSVPNTPTSLTTYGAGLILTNVSVYGRGQGGIDSVNFAEKECVDCRLKGSNKKPVFWP